MSLIYDSTSSSTSHNLSSKLHLFLIFWYFLFLLFKVYALLMLSHVSVVKGWLAKWQGRLFGSVGVAFALVLRFGLAVCLLHHWGEVRGEGLTCRLGLDFGLAVGWGIVVVVADRLLVEYWISEIRVETFYCFREVYSGSCASCSLKMAGELRVRLNLEWEFNSFVKICCRVSEQRCSCQRHSLRLTFSVFNFNSLLQLQYFLKASLKSSLD